MNKMNCFRFIGAKIKYWYFYLILRLKYNRKPSNDGTFDLKVNPGFKNAILKKINE